MITQGNISLQNFNTFKFDDPIPKGGSSLGRNRTISKDLKDRHLFEHLIDVWINEFFELSVMREQINPNLLPYALETGVFPLLDVCVGRILRRDGGVIIVDKEVLRHIADWLRAALINDEPWLKNVDAQGRPKKLMKFGSIEAIIQEADKAMLKAAQKSRAVRIVDGDEEIVEMLDEGFHIVRLLTPAALDRESAEMQHCIGNGGYDNHLNDGRHLYLSLRDPHGKAHVTMEIEDGILIQLQGKQNAPPIRRYIDILVPYIRASGLKVDVPPSHLGYVVDINGEWHPLDNLPEGLTVEGNLNLGGTQITALPEGTSVSGYLRLSSTPITALPARLSVGGFLDLSETPIKELSRGLTVGGGIDLCSTEIISLPEGLSVTGFLDLSGTPIRELPKGLMVGGSFNLSRTKIGALPEGLTVGGSLYLNETSITVLPKGLMVGDNLILDRKKITELPEDLTVGGEVYSNRR